MGTRNWAKAAARDRMHQHGTESVAGRRTAPSHQFSHAPPEHAAKASTRERRLPEPVIVGKFWRNRKGEAVVVQLCELENGVIIADIRINFTTDGGQLQPTKKGVAVSIRHLPELAAALAKAEQKATELGLIAGTAS